MAKFVFCGECGGLKQTEVEPYEDDSAGNYSWSGAFCCCPGELSTLDELEITRDIREARGDYRRRLRFCPHCGLVVGFGKEPRDWRVVGEWLPKWWAESLYQDAKAHFELINWYLEEATGIKEE